MLAAPHLAGGTTLLAIPELATPCSPAAAAALDSWERLREAAAAVLLRLPTPLPGAASPAELQPLLRRALRLLGCPRGREADAGAQLMVLLLRKYGGGGVGGSGSGGCAWLLDLAAGTVQAPADSAPDAGEEEQQAVALWCFFSSSCDLLEQRVQLAREDMLGACRCVCGGLGARRDPTRTSQPVPTRCQTCHRIAWA